jgi:acyl-CoA synthetase (AMP-forming)/AMP-acid ligase II/acyl carrier protein
MKDITTLTELIEAHRTAPRSITYFEGENEAREVSYGELHERALGILYHLQQMGARRGDKLILLLNRNEQFIDAFWAAILGGLIPVPIAPGISDEHRHKLLRIARKLGQPFLYSERRTLDRVGTFAAQAGEVDVWQGLRSRAFVVDDLDDISRAGKPVAAAPQDVAFIQFSSGSTSEPKGVVLTHGNLIANMRGSSQAGEFTQDDVSLSWMPLTHDMGLIGLHLTMFYNRIRTHLMATELFIRRPLLWLQLASRVRASILCSPNFGYKHYLKVLGDRRPEGLDLSSVRLIFNGAEPIHLPLCQEFLDRLEPVGLKRTAMYPVYGLAEASLAVSFPPLGRPVRALALNRHRLSVGNAVEALDRNAADAVELVSEGRAIPYCRVRVTGDDDQPLPDGHVGHVHITGESVTGGYYEAPEVNAATFTADGWLRTGDLGLMKDGELYISGRAKEIIFVNGQNYYPHDLEALVQEAPGLELGKVVAVAARSPGADAEQLVVFVLHRSDLPDLLPLAALLTRLINERAGLEVGAVVPIKRIPKTTSGKIQRQALKDGFENGEFEGELKELAALRAAQRGPGSTSRTQIEDRLKSICDAALEGKRIDVHDNLFEIGASSLKLIEIHEQIDREYPGQVELTELFDYPTIAELAQHLQSKLAAAA